MQQPNIQVSKSCSNTNFFKYWLLVSLLVHLVENAPKSRVDRLVEEIGLAAFDRFLNRNSVPPVPIGKKHVHECGHSCLGLALRSL